MTRGRVTSEFKLSWMLPVHLRLVGFCSAALSVAVNRNLEVGV